MELKNIVPWGRNMQEYMQIFNLGKDDIVSKKFLGCGDGPSSFNTEVDCEGGSVVSIDPLYRYSKSEIIVRIDEVKEEILKQVEDNRNSFVWKEIENIEALENVRVNAMLEFLMDYSEGKEEGRYIDASLPNLPFEDSIFDIALSSHLLFLYSKHLDLKFHIDSIAEMLRVAKEVRIFPIVTLENSRSPHVSEVIKYFKSLGFSASIVKSGYEFQKGANEMLVIGYP